MRRALLATFQVAGLLLAFTLQAAWGLQPIPSFLRLLPLSLLAVSFARPHIGLLILAGIGPMADAISAWAHSPFPGIRLLEQLVLAVVSGAGLRWWRGTEQLRLGDAAALMAASAIASCIAVQPVLLLQQLPEATVSDHLRALFDDGEYFRRSGLWDPVFFAALMVEGLALAVTAERVVRQRHAAAAQTIRMAVVGHAGVAVLSLEQIVGAALRTGDAWPALLQLVRDVRISRFYDVNAAASTFLLMLFGGVGLLKGAGRYAWAVVILLAILASGLWVAGSRVALAAGAVILLGMLWLTAWRTRGTSRWVASAAFVGVIAASLLTVLVYPAARNVSAGAAATTRRIMAQTSFNMWRAAPVFGIGVGRFFEESSRFGGEALQTEMGMSVKNENAHNNFLQILGTEGSVGLGALLLVLGLAIVPAIRAAPDAQTPLRRWLLAGVIASLLTWLTGHPLLVAEASFAFWLVFGVLAGLGPPAAGGTRWRPVVTLAAALVLVSGPFRAAQTIRSADFEHIGIALSQWQPAIDGFRYRLADDAFALYLPADGTAVAVPLRRAPGAPDPLVVTIRLDGQTIDEPVVSGVAWQEIRLQLPDTNRRFARVDFAVRSRAPGDGPLPSPALYVGKAEPR